MQPGARQSTRPWAAPDPASAGRAPGDPRGLPGDLFKLFELAEKVREREMPGCETWQVPPGNWPPEIAEPNLTKAEDGPSGYKVAPPCGITVAFFLLAQQLDVLVTLSCSLSPPRSMVSWQQLGCMQTTMCMNACFKENGDVTSAATTKQPRRVM